MTHSCFSGKLSWECFISPVLPLIWSRTTISQMGQCILSIDLILMEVFWDCYSKKYFFFPLYKRRNRISRRAPANWPLALESQAINHSLQTRLWELSVLADFNLLCTTHGSLREHCRHCQFLSRTGQHERKMPCPSAVIFSYQSTQLPKTAISEHTLLSRSCHRGCAPLQPNYKCKLLLHGTPFGALDNGSLEYFGSTSCQN